MDYLYHGRRTIRTLDCSYHHGLFVPFIGWTIRTIYLYHFLSLLSFSQQRQNTSVARNCSQWRDLRNYSN